MSQGRVGACRFTVPTGWEHVPGQPDDRCIVVEPASNEPERLPFRANLVLTTMLNAGLSFRDWQSGTDELLPQQLLGYQLLDLEKRSVAGLEGGRRLAQHVVDTAAGSVPVTLEQWFFLLDDIGHTLSASVDSVRYDTCADLFAEVADGLVVTDAREGRA